jgi:hypothetical protein
VCTDTPALEAPVDRLTYFRVVGASVTLVSGKGVILIIIVTGVAECNTTLCSTSAAVSLRSWPVIKIARLASLSKTSLIYIIYRWEWLGDMQGLFNIRLDHDS